MNLFHKCFATIDYKNSVVRFQFPNELELKWKGRGSNNTSQIVSNLKAKKMLSKGLDVNENLSYEEFSVEILDHQVKRLRNKEVAPVRVLWGIHSVEGET